MPALAKNTNVAKQMVLSQPLKFSSDLVFPLPLEVQGRGGFNTVFRFFTRSLRFASQPSQIVFTMLEIQADAVSEAAGLAALHAADADARDTNKRLQRLKIRIQESEQILVSRLRSSPISPMTHEDVHSLAVNLRKIVECLEDVVSLQQSLLRPEASVVELSAACAQSMRNAIIALPDGSELAAHAMQMAIFARKVDLELRDVAVARLANEGDVIQQLYQRQTTRVLRALFQQYRGMARALEYALIKNS